MESVGMSVKWTRIADRPTCATPESAKKAAEATPIVAATLVILRLTKSVMNTAS